MKSRFMELAKKMAEFGEHHQHKIGSAIVKKNRVISLGYNKMSTHPKSPHPYRSAHSELCSILKANKEDLENSVIYVYRETKNGLPALSRPCKYCMMAIREAKIKGIYYSTEIAPFYNYEEVA